MLSRLQTLLCLLVFIVLAGSLTTSCSNKKITVAKIETEKGTIVCMLYTVSAPKHSKNFIKLAKEGFYADLTFHRVVPGFVIQGGDPKGDGTGSLGYTIPAEIGIAHNKGALAMARKGGRDNLLRESSGSQFYICLEAQPRLDGQYSVFGQTIEGMDVVEKIEIGDKILSVTIEERTKADISR